MKNTKHTKMNDSSIEQDNQENLSQSKRKILTSIGVTSGVVGASALVPSTWVKPAVNSVILPAHAQSTPPIPPPTTPMETTPPYVNGQTTTMMPTTTTMMPTTTTTEAPAMAAILVAPDEIGVVMRPAAPDDFSQTFQVSLNTMPTAPVTVTATSDSSGTTVIGVPVVFTTSDWNVPKLIAYTDDTAEPANMAAESSDPFTVTFTASGGGSGYAGVETEVTYTIGYFGNEAPTMVVATKSGKSATVTWVLPETRNTPTDYVVDAGTVAESMIVNHPGTEAVFSNLADGTYAFTVQARYSSGTNPGAVMAASSISIP